VVGLALSALLGPRAHPLLLEAAATLVEINLLLMVVNLLPLPGLDGYHAWRLFAPSNLSALFRRSRSRWLRERARQLERKLNEMKWKRGVN